MNFGTVTIEWPEVEKYLLRKLTLADGKLFRKLSDGSLEEVPLPYTYQKGEELVFVSADEPLVCS